jgi:hypothetical protein
MQVGILDLIQVACESRMLSLPGLMSASAERQLFLALRARQESSEAVSEKARAAFAPLSPPKKTETDLLSGTLPHPRPRTGH